jgi:hypothetical protein
MHYISFTNIFLSTTEGINEPTPAKRWKRSENIELKQLQEKCLQSKDTQINAIKAESHKNETAAALCYRHGTGTAFLLTFSCMALRDGRNSPLERSLSADGRPV